jgi:hypothetical protein
MFKPRTFTQPRASAAVFIALLFTCLQASAFAADAGDSMSTKDLIESGLGMGTLLLATVGIWSGTRSAKKAVVEKRRENRHKQLTAAKDLLKEVFADPMAGAALKMMDWSGRTYFHQGATYTIHSSELEAALVEHNKNLAFTKEQQFIRDCFETFFDHMLVIEHFIKQQYLDQSDVAIPLKYYAEHIVAFARVYQPFINAYGYVPAYNLLERLALQSGTNATSSVKHLDSRPELN